MKHKKHLLISVSFTICIIGTAQSKLNEPTFRKILNSQFTQIVSGQSNKTIGNFAAVDIKDARLTLNGSALTKKGNVFSLTANADVSDGFSAIFTNSKLNSNVGLQFRLSLLNPYTRMVRFTKSSLDRRDDEISKIKSNQQFQKNLISSRAKFVDESIRFTEFEIEKLQSELRTTPNGEKVRYQIAQLQYERDSLIAVKQLEFTDVSKSLQRIDKAAQTAINKANVEKIDVTGFGFGWLNISYGVNSQSFRLFNPSLNFPEQVTKESYTSHRVDVQYSYYRWSIHPGETFFFQVGANGGYDNNLAALNAIELSEKTEYGSTVDQRSSVRKYKVFTGNYNKNLITASLYADYYHFFLNNNTIALHAYPQINLSEGEQPLYSFGLGLLMALKDSKDEKSIVNVEIYSHFIDLTNVNNSTKKLLGRNEIGFRLAFPIKFYNPN